MHLGHVDKTQKLVLLVILVIRQLGRSQHEPTFFPRLRQLVNFGLSLAAGISQDPPFAFRPSSRDIPT